MTDRKVKIKGIAPLLMHKTNVGQEEAGPAPTVYKAEDDAKKGAYYDKKIGMYVPSNAIEACLREVGKKFRLKGKGKTTLKNTILASVFVQEEKIPLKKKSWDEIDSRVARIQRNQIVRHRPRFNSWELEFTISFDETQIDEATMKALFDEAGKTQGILDYRPKFGRFEVIQFKK